jgi:hypothetical protein
VIAMISAFVIFLVLGHFTSQSYPEESERLDVPTEVKQIPIELLFQGHLRLALVVAMLAAITVVIIGTFRMERWKTALPAVLLLAIGACACVVLHYHIGVIVLLLGAILWFRAGVQNYSRLLFIGALVGAAALLQLYILHGTGEFPGRTIIGAFVGTPSVWPMLRFAEFSPLGIAVLAAPIAFAVYRLGQGQRIPMHFLFFAIAVWAQLFAIGLMRWYVAERYTIGALPFFLLGVVAAVVYLVEKTRWGTKLRQQSMAMAAAVVLLVAVIINPAAAWQAARNDYRDHPDHKGAAEFVRSLNPGPEDIIIAEDCISHTYYIGKVDFRLQDVAAAKNHSILRDGVLYGQYSNVPVIGSGRQFEELLDRQSSGNIYIISSAQVTEGMQRRNRASGIAEVLASDRLELMYVGRDRKTKVWRLRRH